MEFHESLSAAPGCHEPSRDNAPKVGGGWRQCVVVLQSRADRKPDDGTRLRFCPCQPNPGRSSSPPKRLVYVCYSGPGGAQIGSVVAVRAYVPSVMPASGCRVNVQYAVVGCVGRTGYLCSRLCFSCLSVCSKEGKMDTRLTEAWFKMGRALL